MGDYLNHLTARVSGIQAAVRPRLPSLFEPPQGLTSSRISSMFPARRAEHEEASETVEKVSTALTAPVAEPQIPAVREKPTTTELPVIRMRHDEGKESRPASAQPPPEHRLVVHTKRAI